LLAASQRSLSARWSSSIDRAAPHRSIGMLVERDRRTDTAITASPTTA